MINCSGGTCPVGSLVVVLKYSASPRALRVDTYRGRLAVNTQGSTYGHSAAAAATTVAAVDVATAGGGNFTGGPANPVESFSSDGPRRIFYYANGSPITPGNVLFGTGGGSTLQKVDVAAADGVSTAEPFGGGLNPFFGTSAAAPHAAALAALVWSAHPSLTAASVKSALFGSALDIEASGFDRDSGVAGWVVVRAGPYSADCRKVVFAGFDCGGWHFDAHDYANQSQRDRTSECRIYRFLPSSNNKCSHSECRREWARM